MEAMIFEASRRIANMKITERHIDESLRAFTRASDKLDPLEPRLETVMLGAVMIAHIEALRDRVGSRQLLQDLVRSTLDLDMYD